MAPSPSIVQALAVYGTVAEALGYPPCLLNIQFAAHTTESGDLEEALEKLQTVVRELKGETERAHPLLGASVPHGGSYYRTLARMLQNDLRSDPKLQSLRENTQFKEFLVQM